ncbi:hypothetical protein DMUE_6043, partial [Dictyocoela muelleri]
TLELNENDEKYLNKIDNMRDYFVRIRNKKFKNNENNNDEILEMYKYTFSKKEFLQFDTGFDSEERIIIFYTLANVEILKKSIVWLGDGTFYSSPKGFEQIYILHASYFSKIIPIIYIFIKRKTVFSYNNAFSFIKRNLNIEPKIMIVDFEFAPYKAFKENFKTTEIQGCYFHFTQIVIRFLKTNGFIEKYRFDFEFQKFVKYLLFLTYVPIHAVISEFEKTMHVEKS